MRSLTLLAIACYATSALAQQTEGQGSIQALLERLSHRSIKEPELEVAKRSPNETDERSISDKKARNFDDDDAARVERLLQRMNRNNVKQAKKRYIWGTAIINDGDLNAPPIGVNTNLLGDYGVPTPNGGAAPIFSVLPTPPVEKPSLAAQPSVAPDVQAFDASQAASLKNAAHATSSPTKNSNQRTKTPPGAVNTAADPANRRTKQMPHNAGPTVMAKVRRATRKEPASSSTSSSTKNRNQRTKTRLSHTDDEPTPVILAAAEASTGRTKELPTTGSAANRRTKDLPTPASSNSANTNRRTKTGAPTQTPSRLKARTDQADDDASSDLVEETYYDESDDEIYVIPAGSIDDILPSDALDSATGAAVAPSAGSASLDDVDDELFVDEAKREKRWVWATSIIQDSSPTSGLPSIGANVNLLSSATTLSTPKAALSPSFMSIATPISAHVVQPVILPSSSPRTTSTSSSARRTKGVPLQTQQLIRVPRAHKARNEAHQHFAKKWIQGPSIIQDGDPVPTVGVVVGTTPNANGIDPPTFMPIPSAVAATAEVKANEAPTPVQQVVSPTNDATLSAASSTPSPAAGSAQKDPNWFQRQWSKFVNWWHKMFNGNKDNKHDSSSSSSSVVAPASTSS